MWLMALRLLIGENKQMLHVYCFVYCILLNIIMFNSIYLAKMKDKPKNTPKYSHSVRNSFNKILYFDQQKKNATVVIYCYISL